MKRVCLLLLIGLCGCQTGAPAAITVSLDGAWRMAFVDRAGFFPITINGAGVVDVGGVDLTDRGGSATRSGQLIIVSFIVPGETIFTDAGPEEFSFAFSGTDQGDGSFIGTLRWTSHGSIGEAPVAMTRVP